MPRKSPTPPKDLRSPEVHPDGVVTFRIWAPKAKTVLLAEDIIPSLNPPEPVPLTKGDNGIWEVTLGPLAPDIYDYAFHVDGVRTPDPANWFAKSGAIPPVSRVNVPGHEPRFFDLQAVPHGIIQRHTYYASTLAAERELYIYLPPNYDPARAYPILYLLHGRGELANAWLDMGYANRIADNLIAAHRLQPPILVMPLGFSIPTLDDLYAPNVWHAAERFADELLTDILPFVESRFPITERAIAGLSMGGYQSQGIALSQPQRFIAAGLFSGAFGNLAETLPTRAPIADINAHLRLLWVANGNRDDLVGPSVNAALADFTTLGITHQFHPYSGGHSWPIWRPMLRDFLTTLWPA